MTYEQEVRSYAVSALVKRSRAFAQVQDGPSDVSKLPRAGAFAPEPPGDQPSERYPTANVTVPSGKTLHVKVADTPALRAVGLQNAPDAGASEGYDGMLFRWPANAQSAMHNKNVNFPVSVSWFDSSSMYVDEAHLLPQQGDPAFPKAAHRHALEVHSKDWDSLGIGPGTQISIADEKRQDTNGTVSLGDHPKGVENPQ